MCGIIGFTKNKEYEERLPEMLEIQAHRGEDSYGAVFVFEKELVFLKSLKIEDFLDKFDEIAERNYQFVIIHHRNASIGGVNLELAHPLNYKSTWIVHNGTKKSLYETFKSKGDSDTAIIAYLGENLGFKDNVFRTAISNVGVVFGFNQTEKFFHHDGKRSLFLYEDKTLISSEPVIEGNWKLIKGKHQFNYNSWNYLVDNLKTYDYNIEIDDFLYESYCLGCNEVHLHTMAEECVVCKGKGEEMTEYYDFDTNYIQTNPEYVFVYGTLKQNYGNYHVMERAKGIKICDAVTKDKFVMGGGGIPYVVKVGEPKHQIKGELYKVFNMQPLDDLEGHPTFYRREKIEVICENGKKQTAWIYFYTGNMVAEEEWINEKNLYEFPKDTYDWDFEDSYQECDVCGNTHNLVYLEDEDAYICQECLDYFNEGE